MESLKELRRAHYQMVARFFGTHADHPRLLTPQRTAASYHGEILGLPEFVIKPLQILDVEDERFGSFCFSLDEDGLGDSSL